MYLPVTMRTCWGVARDCSALMTDALVGLSVPPICTVCRSAQLLEVAPPVSLAHARLCDRCLMGFLGESHSACLKCGAQIGPYVDSSNGCLSCRRRDFRFHEVVRLGVYRDELRRAVIRGKGRGQQALSAALTEALLAQHTERLQELNADVVTCVPCFWIKRLFEPHHQAETIATIISERLSLPLDLSLLIKTRHTRDQSDLPREKRLKNLDGAFRVRPDANLRGRSVMLVDDVLTTGTTANECARALRKAGAAHITVVVIARVL